ncbi:MAG: asparagine synthetase B family protein, partial [Thermomicrobiales bacterium]
PLAFAIWNGGDRTAMVSRDRMGHVPMFYGKIGRDLLIATHLRAFDAHPEFGGDINANALAGILRYRAAPVPTTIFRDIFQLFPGELLAVNNSEGTTRFKTSLYWSIGDEHRAALAEISHATPSEVSTELQRRITMSIQNSFTDATSPVSVFFSAGVDSNLVAAVATTTSHPVHTFTCRFDGDLGDEGPVASQIAALLGTQHTTLTITPDGLLKAIGQSADVYGQPHGDQAGLPGLLMAEAAALDAPLIITGDAGNDLLGSNKSLTKNFPLLSFNDAVPISLRRPASILASGGARTIEVFETAVNRFAPASKAAKIRAGGLRRISATLAADQPELIYGIRSSLNVNPERYLAIDVMEAPANYQDPTRWLGAGDRYDRWRHVELRNASIDVEGSKHEAVITASGAGYRAPLLDARVIPYAFRIPDAILGNNGIDRWPSVDIVRRITGDPAKLPVPGGFGVPTDKWMRSDLRPWAEALLSESNLRATGIFNVNAVRMEWRQHQSGLHDRRYVLWPILMTLAWIDARANRSS